MEENEGWKCLPFQDLTALEVYDVLQLRSLIFVVEQDCAYLDPDGLDRSAWHWLYQPADRLLAYQRCLPPGIPHRESSIGRIIVHASQRGRDLGRQLVQRGITFNRQQWPDAEILVAAQSHLQSFYGSMGFESCSDEYLEDGIPHVDMRYVAP